MCGDPRCRGIRGFSTALPCGRQASSRAGHAHYLGAVCVLRVTWQPAIVVGMTPSSLVPESLSMEFVIPLYLVAMVIPKGDHRAARIAAVVEAVAAVAAVAGQSAMWCRRFGCGPPVAT